MTEEVIAKASGGSGGNDQFNHPEGSYAMRCIDLIDAGLVDRTYKGRTKKQHRICLRFFGGEYTETENGPQPLWLDAWYTLSLADNANLRRDLEAWRGKTFTDEQLQGFNVAVLLDKGAWITVGHKKGDTRTFVNVLSIAKLPPGTEPPTLDGYVRVKDRPPRDSDVEHVEPEEDSGLPF